MTGKRLGNPKRHAKGHPEGWRPAARQLYTSDPTGRAGERGSHASGADPGKPGKIGRIIKAILKQDK